jgi:hypothetical protein
MLQIRKVEFYKFQSIFRVCPQTMSVLFPIFDPPPPIPVRHILSHIDQPPRLEHPIPNNPTPLFFGNYYIIKENSSRRTKNAQTF